MSLLDLLPQTKAEAVKDAVAVGAIASPLWLNELSGIAAHLLPVAGLIWLTVQIIIKIHTTYWRK